MLKITGMTYKQVIDSLQQAAEGGAYFIASGAESGDCGHKHRKATGAGDCQRKHAQARIRETGDPRVSTDRYVYLVSPDGSRRLLTYEEYCIASRRW